MFLRNVFPCPVSKWWEGGVRRERRGNIRWRIEWSWRDKIGHSFHYKKRPPTYPHWVTIKIRCPLTILSKERRSICTQSFYNRNHHCVEIKECFWSGAIQCWQSWSTKQDLQPDQLAWRNCGTASMRQCLQKHSWEKHKSQECCCYRSVSSCRSPFKHVSGIAASTSKNDAFHESWCRLTDEPTTHGHL